MGSVGQGCGGHEPVAADLAAGQGAGGDMVMAGLMMIGMIAMCAIPALTAATVVVFASLHTQRSGTVRALLGFIVQPPRLRDWSGRMPLGAPGGLWRVESQACPR